MIMQKAILKPIIVLAILALAGCAPLKFISNAGSGERSGLKYYTVKPYFLVEKADGNVVKATVIYLPDVANPQYMIIRGGIGSRKVDIKITEGSINTLGVTSDPKIAETLEALATLVTKGVSAVKDVSALNYTPRVNSASTVLELYEIIMDSSGTTLKKVEFK
jgi:hypothetical protein